MKKLIFLLIFLFFLPLAFTEDQTFKKLNGDNITYNQLVSAENTILFVWATWCPSCRQEILHLTQNYSDPENINIFYVSVDGKEKIVQSFFKQNNLDDKIKKKVIIDGSGFIAQKFSVFAIPTYVFLKNGKLRDRSHYLNTRLLEEVFKPKE